MSANFNILKNFASEYHENNSIKRSEERRVGKEC